MCCYPGAPFQCPLSPVHRCPGAGGWGHAAQLHGASSDHLGDPRCHHPVRQADLCGHAGGTICAPGPAHVSAGFGLPALQAKAWKPRSPQGLTQLGLWGAPDLGFQGSLSESGAGMGTTGVLGLPAQGPVSSWGRPGESMWRGGSLSSHLRIWVRSCHPTEGSSALSWSCRNSALYVGVRPWGAAGVGGRQRQEAPLRMQFCRRRRQTTVEEQRSKLGKTYKTHAEVEMGEQKH